MSLIQINNNNEVKICKDEYIASNNKDINNEYSFNCIPRYFVAEGYVTLHFTKQNAQLGISLKPFLNIPAGSIVSIERVKQSILIKHFYNPNWSIKETWKVLNKHLDHFEQYPGNDIKHYNGYGDGYYNEKMYNFKLQLTQS
jgi:hypothetical protein